MNHSVMILNETTKFLMALALYTGTFRLQTFIYTERAKRVAVSARTIDLVPFY